MEPMYYIGLDVHKRTISYCVKEGSGKIHVEGTIPATRLDLDHWLKTLSRPWSAAMEATLFTGWIYDHLKAPRSRPEGGTSSDAAGHRRGEKEERIASMPARFAIACHAIFCRSATGFDGDSGTATHATQSELAGAPGC